MSPLQNAKLLIMDITQLGKDALHVYVGLSIMLAVAGLLRRSLGDWRPLLAVAIAAFAGELWDLADTLSQGRRPRPNANWKDVWNTLFWPTVLFVLARSTKVLKR